MSIKFRYLVLIGFIFLFSTVSVAQFSYVGMRLSYHNVRFDDNGTLSTSEEESRMNNMVVNLDFVHRPIRYLGMGISTRIPVIKGFNYAYDFDGNIVGSGGFDGYEESTFAGGEFQYDVTLKSSVTVFSRIFFSLESNLYLDLRYTVENYEESFSYFRQGQSLPDMNVSRNYTITSRGFGFACGYMPRIDDHFYFKYLLAYDFLTTDQTFFLTAIEAETFNGKQTVVIPSKIEDTSTAFELSMGIGYIF